MYALPPQPHHLHASSDSYRVVFSLIIINKAGGLIYQRDFAEGLNKLGINDYLVLAGTFHRCVCQLPISRFPSLYKQPAKTSLLSVHALTTRLHPLAYTSNTHLSSTPSSRPDPPSGIEVLE